MYTPFIKFYPVGNNSVFHTLVSLTTIDVLATYLCNLSICLSNQFRFYKANLNDTSY